MGPLLYLVAIVLSLFSPEWSLALCALVPILYILPGRLDIHWGARGHVKPKPVQAAVKKS